MATTDLSVPMDDGKTTVVPGTSDTYTITVTNNGPSTVTSLTLTDSIPAALLNATFGTPSVGSYDSGSGLWSGLSLASGQSVSITLTGTIDPNFPGPLTNIVTVSAPAGTTDPDPGNNSFADTDTLTPQADVTVSIDDGKTSVVPGTSNSYFITIANNGPSTVSSLTVVTDSIPALLNPQFFLPSSFLLTGIGPSGIDFSLVNDLTPGATATLQITGTIDPNATGTLSNTVTVSTLIDSTLSTSTATDTDTLALPADLAVTITDAPPLSCRAASTPTPSRSPTTGRTRSAVSP